ncbi:amidohydrolase family protein [Escherichia fergusonii]|uniref:amidohydrolase family protein n=1 Tax=Escherichia fergusonii TaxID=564 RepID=UPI00311962D5
MRFDTHAHVFRLGLPLAEQCRYVPEYDATPEHYLSHLDQHGFDKAILIQPSFLGTDNHYMLEAIRRYPDRFFGVAVIDITTSLSAMEEMKRNGIVGIRLNLIGQPIPDLTSPLWRQFLIQIKNLDWHVELHRPVAVLRPLIEALLQAGVKIVIDHFGLPKDKVQDSGFNFLLKQASSRNIWVKISASYRNGDYLLPADNVGMLLSPLLKNVGADRLLWGSDWPHTRYETRITYEKTVHEFFNWPLSEKERNMILEKSVVDLLTL